MYSGVGLWVTVPRACSGKGRDGAPAILRPAYLTMDSTILAISFQMEG